MKQSLSSLGFVNPFLLHVMAQEGCNNNRCTICVVNKNLAAETTNQNQVYCQVGFPKRKKKICRAIYIIRERKKKKISQMSRLDVNVTCSATVSCYNKNSFDSGRCYNMLQQVI